MVQLKQVSLRLKSIRNIQKITKTMKMVSASKFTKAERELKAARPFGYGPRKFYESSALLKGPVDKKTDKDAKEAPPTPPAPEPTPADKQAEGTSRRIFIAVTSDRGLCGAVHSGVARRIRREMALMPNAADAANVRLVCIGEKSRTMLRRDYANNIMVTARNVGRIAPVFGDASLTAAAVARAGFEYDIGEIFYNKYHSPVKYEMSMVPFFNKRRIDTAPNMSAFDDVDEDEIESYSEWTLAALLYYALKESAASEQSARMAAMDNATKNAAEMIKKLALLFNRTRQAVITRELIEIISGASALK